MSEKAEFGKWRKDRNATVWRPKDGHPYAVALTDGGQGYTATLTGDDPVLLHTAPVAGQTDKQALKAAQDACEQHWAEQQQEAPTEALDWCDDCGDLVAVLPDGTSYRLHEPTASYRLHDPEGNLWVARYEQGDVGLDLDRGLLLGTATTPEPLQELCRQHHAGRGLEWQDEGANYWQADGYACEPAQDNEQWLAVATAGPLPCQELGAGDTLEEAQAICQIHRGKQLLALDKPTELEWRESAPELWVASSAKLWPSEDYSCAKGDDGLWQPGHRNEPIGDPDTLEEAQAICQTHHDIQEAPIGQPTTPQRERGKWTIRRPPSQELLATLAKKQADLDEELEQLEVEVAGSALRHKAVKERVAERTAEIRDRARQLREEVYHGIRAELDCWRRRVGDEWVYEDESGAEVYREPAAEGDQQLLLSKDAPTPDKPPEPEDEAEPTDEADGVRLSTSEQRPTLEWKRVPLDGQPAYRAGVAGGEYRVERQDSGGPGKGLLQAIWAPTGGDRLELPGEHVKVGDAKAEAEKHWQSRLLWVETPGDPTQLYAGGGAYQVRQCKGGVGWLAYHGETLLAGDKTIDMEEAQAICQAHADSAAGWTR